MIEQRPHAVWRAHSGSVSKALAGGEIVLQSAKLKPMVLERA
jgi:hypothetical protein